MRLRAITAVSDCNKVMKRIEALMDPRPNAVDGDTLDVLATLAEALEEKHHRIDPPDPIDAIRFAMEQRGLSRHDLEPLIGSRARVAEILNYKRTLTLPMIRRLHDELGIPAEVLIRPSRRNSAA